MPRTRKTRRRTNINGLTSDFILDVLRLDYPRALDLRRRGDAFCILRKPGIGEALKSNQRGVWEELATFDEYRLTADGRLTTRPFNARPAHLRGIFFR